MKTTTKQNMIATSDTAKQFVKDEADSFSAPNKSGDIQNASQREIVDAMQSFVEAKRYEEREMPVMVEETNDEGESVMVDSGEVEMVEVDTFEEFVQDILKERLTNVRANSGKAVIEKQQSEIEALKAQLAKLTEGK